MELAEVLLKMDNMEMNMVAQNSGPSWDESIQKTLTKVWPRKDSVRTMLGDRSGCSYEYTQ